MYSKQCLFTIVLIAFILSYVCTEASSSSNLQSSGSANLKGGYYGGGYGYGAYDYGIGYGYAPSYGYGYGHGYGYGYPDYGYYGGYYKKK